MSMLDSGKMGLCSDEVDLSFFWHWCPPETNQTQVSTDSHGVSNSAQQIKIMYIVARVYTCRQPLEKLLYLACNMLYCTSRQRCTSKYRVLSCCSAWISSNTHIWWIIYNTYVRPPKNKGVLMLCEYHKWVIMALSIHSTDSPAADNVATQSLRTTV